MIKAAKNYVKYVEATNRVVGKYTMYLIFVMIAILLFEAFSRTFFNTPHIWSVELTQFIMAAYYLLGGGWTLQIGGHVRMDLFYAKRSPKHKALIDICSFFIILVYMIILIIGGVQSLQYSILYNQVSYSAWAPKVTPIKLIMFAGLILMFLQVIAELVKDIAIFREEEIS